MTLSSTSLPVLLLLPWAALWGLGGFGLTRGLFRLLPWEEWLVAIALGWVTQNWLANLVAQVLPMPLAFWISALAVFLAGGLALALSGEWKTAWRMELPVYPIAGFGVITAIFFAISRGMAIFDDFQHLATISMMAAGDFPPHFALDPAVIFGYHHFLQLFAAQVVRVGSLFPWVAVDVGRALSFGLAVMLSALYARRVTGNKLAGLLGGMMVAFGSGARWLLLLLPTALVAALSKNIHLIGSGLGSGVTLSEALMSTWAVEGAGPLPFPFAFANGIFPPGVIQAHTANGLIPFVIIFLLLLTFNRWRNWGGAVISTILISIWGLLGEAELPGILLGWGLVTLGFMLRQRSMRLPRMLWVWLSVVAAGSLIGFLEGGALTDILVKAFEKISGAPPSPSYQTVGFAFSWPPAIVSSHLGVLSLSNPAQALVALLELGPVLLVLPLMFAWGMKAFRAQRWYEAGTAATALGMLLMVFVQFTGSTGVRNTPRLYVFMPLLAALAVPLTWLWAARRASQVKVLVGLVALVTLAGGVVMAGVQLPAAQRPVYSSFLTTLDARMSRAYWNRLAPGALVFDAIPYRSPAIFGRPTDSSYTWYQTKPEWEALLKTPDPRRLAAAGFRYAYLDNRYWDQLDPHLQQALSGGCVQTVGRMDDPQGNFRLLLDLSACR